MKSYATAILIIALIECTCNVCSGQPVSEKSNSDSLSKSSPQAIAFAEIGYFRTPYRTWFDIGGKFSINESWLLHASYYSISRRNVDEGNVRSGAFSLGPSFQKSVNSNVKMIFSIGIAVSADKTVTRQQVSRNNTYQLDGNDPFAAALFPIIAFFDAISSNTHSTSDTITSTTNSPGIVTQVDLLAHSKHCGLGIKWFGILAKNSWSGVCINFSIGRLKY